MITETLLCPQKDQHLQRTPRITYSRLCSCEDGYPNTWGLINCPQPHAGQEQGCLADCFPPMPGRELLAWQTPILPNDQMFTLCKSHVPPLGVIGKRRNTQESQHQDLKNPCRAETVSCGWLYFYAFNLDFQHHRCSLKYFCIVSRMLVVQWPSCPVISWASPPRADEKWAVYGYGFTARVADDSLALLRPQAC